ncbi:MAG: hypothetical protein EXS64_04165 [Candidatus Latescibacteria bacterium]|nr:hypothetical protein [Candidatus Latescibacterota bacterium]
MIFGAGRHTYEVVEGWGQLPEGWAFKQAAGVAVDAQDRVYVFCRGEHPVIVFDREGRFLKAWGEGVFKMPHGICIGPDGNLYLVDAGDHTVRVYTPEGGLLRTLGQAGQPVEERPFNKPTDLAFSPSGAFYVSDGYGNARVHKFSKDGELLFSWGTPGDGPGEFRLPHSVWVDREERVYVADRENHRIQVFTPEGAFLSQWTGFQRPCDIFIDAEGAVYVPELHHRMSILSLDGAVLARWGDAESRRPGEFIAPHAAWTDSRGDLYVGEVLEGQRLQKFARK